MARENCTWFCSWVQRLCAPFICSALTELSYQTVAPTLQYTPLNTEHIKSSIPKLTSNLMKRTYSYLGTHWDTRQKSLHIHQHRAHTANNYILTSHTFRSKLNLSRQYSFARTLIRHSCNWPDKMPSHEPSVRLPESIWEAHERYFIPEQRLKFERI